MKILVIGGTGFIGYHIIKEAKKKIIPFIASHLKPQKKISSKSKLCKRDISKYDQLKN